MSVKEIIDNLSCGNIVAIPMDSIYGISCVIKKEVVQRVIKIKQRDLEKGFIIISSVFEHFEPFIDETNLNPVQRKQLRTIDDEIPTTWVVPSKTREIWLNGKYKSIAIRLTKNPLIDLICHALKSPVITTSANISGCNEILCYEQIFSTFGNKLDYIYHSYFISQKSTRKPSRILNVINNKVIRM